MGKLNFMLLLLVIFCAIKVIESQHESRTLFVSLGQAQDLERQLEVEFSRLKLEQAALAKGERVDRIARTALDMSAPGRDRTLFMTSEGRVLNE